MSGKIIARVRQREYRKRQNQQIAEDIEIWNSRPKPTPFWLAVGLPATVCILCIIIPFTFILLR